ncbi:MAG: T9SS type A sorting domain-containing protein [Chitinophagaceae bacterium]|nr:MAG: T9SS type A sorting domain-containing protein [Chitinophagaceae bacterium]
MPRVITLQIPDACTESWDGMKPVAGGRYCASCQKKVIDFTGMPDDAIARFFEASKGPVCGQFYPDQLNRPIPVPRRPLPFLRHLAAILFPALLLSIRSGAQAVRTKARWVQSSKPAGRDKPLLLCGSIRDDRGEPLPFASLSSGGKSWSADTAGAFAIELYAGQLLTVSAVGHNPRTVEVDAAVSDRVIVLNRAANELDQVVVKSYAGQRMLGGIAGGVYWVRRYEKVQAEAKPSISAYPNPVASGGTLHIRLQNLPEGYYRLQLITLGGQVVHSARAHYDKKQGAPIQLPSPGVLAGNYILRLVHEKTEKSVNTQVVVLY